jgi:hypothetical protein
MTWWGNARKRDNPEKLCKKICAIFRQEELFTRILTNFQLEEEYFKFNGG